MNSIIRRFLPVVGTVVFATSAMAQVTATGSITLLRTGWNADSFAVVLNGAVVNPAFCSTPDGYISEVSMPGYQTYLSAALAAYQSRRTVTVTVRGDQCFAGRPVILGINLQ
jgi:hypothetical protein